MNKTKINQAEIDQLLKNSSSQAESQSKISSKNKKKSAKIIGTTKPQKIQKDQTESFKKDKNRKNKQENEYGEDFQQQQQKYSKVSSQPIQSNYQAQNFQQTAEIIQQQQPQQNTKTKFPKLQTKNQYEESYQQQKQKKASEQAGLDQVQSQYASQIIDDVAEQLNQSIGDHQKDKDDQLSLAQSQFIQSGKLNGKSGLAKKVSKQKFIPEKKNDTIQVNKNNGAKKQKLKEQTRPKTKPKQNANKIQNTSQNNQKNKKIAKTPVENKPTKIKRTEDEIKESLQAIQQEKKRIQQQKQKKKQQQLQQKKKIYEQALQKQKQKRQKNKAVLQEQQKKKKAGKNVGADSFKKQTRNLDLQVKQIVNKQKSQIKSYKYFQMNEQRKKNEKQIAKKIQQENKKKLKQLQIKNQVKKIKGEEKKKQFLKIKQNLQQAKRNEKKQEDKQQDILLIKKIKKEIAELKSQNEQKRKKIFQFEKSVELLKKSLKEKQKQFYSRFNQNTVSTQKEQVVTTTNISDLTPIQRFITFFPSAKSCQEIYKILDENNDQMLSKQQILSKIKRQGVPDEISDEIFKILDRNSDGEITLQQFVFNIESQIQKQIDYRRIMGEIQITDPIDIEAKIIDMRSKINYMDKKIKAEQQNEQSIYDKKSKEYLQKIAKIQQQFRKQKQAKSSVTTDLLNSDSTPLLLKQLSTLQNQLKMHTKLLQAIKVSFNTNLNSKNKTLMLRVQQNLSLKQKLYNLKNEIQQTQLRYLSLKKIEQNKKGYLQKRSKERQQMQQIYMKTQQYQLRIADPTKQTVNRKYARDVQFLAAVIMIQRNFRARKARRLTQQKKNNLTLESK